jgi:nucleoside-diphosphate-sugar epimerase
LRTLVTGGTGFLGSAVVKSLVQAGHAVTVLSRRPPNTGAHTGLSFVAGDLADPQSVTPEIMRDVDVLIHCAVSYGSYARQMRVNVEGTRALAEAAAAAGIRRFVHISSLAVYGYRISGTTTEETRPAPAKEAYSTTKAAAEQALQEAVSAAGLEYTIIRPGAIYGPGSGMWTDTMFRWAARPIVLFAGSGSGTVPLIYIDDLVDLIMRCAQDPAAKNQIFQAVGPQTTWRAYLEAYARLRGSFRWVGVPVPIVSAIARIIALGDRGQRRLISLPDMVQYASTAHNFSTDKASALLGWKPHTTLEKGIASTVPYLRGKGWLAE